MNNLFVGNSPLKLEEQSVSGQFVLIEGEKYYQIKNLDAMQPFFISLASDSDHWMYISSTGGLSAGRKNPDTALFPYYTDDKITESADITGSKTILHVHKNGNRYLWEPFSDRNNGAYILERTISKSTTGNKLIFGEMNLDLGLTFCYMWMNADDFGWVKKSWLINDSQEEVEVTLLDGLQNILPSGIDRLTQNTYSTLVDGYKKTELIEEANLALFRMEAILVDRPEPSESLRVNTVWSYGLNQPSFLLSSKQLSNFRKGIDISPEHESKGVRGAFFAHCKLTLSVAAMQKWYFVAEVNQDAAKVNNLIHFLKNTIDIDSVIEQNIAKGTVALKNIVSQVDGVQQTADEHGMARHFANSLFNAMRGGVYNDNYNINSADFAKHVKHFNTKVWLRNSDFLTNLPVEIEYSDLELLVQKQADANLYRLFQEYLPLTFSRRHGDPSRPWNLFNINVKDENGNKVVSYQGNWRDIFQNWEALSLSYPAYINGIIAKFLNATTADGYNPYRVTSEGIDWEVIEPEDPWSNIGYWGDHQIIYLLKLLEVSRNHYPEVLNSCLNKEMFAYANVPYRLKNYNEIVADPKNSIRFDDKLHHSIEELVDQYGADAKLLLNNQDEVLLVSLTEKLLATLLSKLSNFIPEAGIWMNTLRPEWNDANNALVGQGASMVTLYYMRRFVVEIREFYLDANQQSFTISTEMADFLFAITNVLNRHAMHLSKGFDNIERRQIADELGNAGSNFRDRIYHGFLNKKSSIAKQDLLDFFLVTLHFIDQSIHLNKREDKLYHAYNLVSFSKHKLTIRNLYEMLEGQVAVLSSGKLDASEAVELLDSLRKSALYRPDQNSYILYPNKQLPDFLAKNRISADAIQQIPFLYNLLEVGDRSIITNDKKGEYHFNANFNNVNFLRKELLNLKKNSNFEISNSDITAIEMLYEQTFDHQSFTGRSGTFYKYEGLGCIYWHMVSKLLLAIGENIQKAIKEQADPLTIQKLKQHYSAVKDGIGAHKSPAEYGSFPFDPYSHTPMMAGAQQPGMTGQVKEDIISRFFELGISIEKGLLTIQPKILRKDEFVDSPKGRYLSFTYCACSFVYHLGEKQGVEILYQDGSKAFSESYLLNNVDSDSIFRRDGKIMSVDVYFTTNRLD
ncbi:MAG: hypothetical protein PHV20_01095 [Bacteroidales bacterium]|nr:hypothetical protein [Bacteroidales bacterium]